jgi:hypothetical protein
VVVLATDKVKICLAVVDHVGGVGGGKGHSWVGCESHERVLGIW